MLKSATVALVLLTVGAAALEAQAASTGYAPGTHRYRVTRESKSVQEMMGQSQAGAISTFEEFTLDLRPAGKDTLRFSITIDSASRTSDAPTGTEEPVRKGLKVSGRVAPNGAFHQFDREPKVDEALSGPYRNFLPQLPAAGVKMGATWSDTIRAPFSQGGIDGTTVTTIDSRVLGDTTVGGQKAWRIERTGRLSMSGTGNQNGADLILSGSGTASGMSLIGTNGVYLGATSTQDLSMTVEVPAASMTIPIKQTTVVRIERIAGAPGIR